MVPVSFPEGSKLLYAVGVLFGVLALAYFGSELVFALSPTVKSILLFTAFVVLLVLAGAIERPELDAAVYALAAGSYLVSVWYLIATFDLGKGGVFLVLGLSSLLFLGLGYLVRETGLVVGRRAAVGVLIVGVVLAGGLIAADALGPQPTYAAEFDEEVSVEGTEPWSDVRVGTLVVENEHVLSRTLDAPTYEACSYTAGDLHQRDEVRTDGYENEGAQGYRLGGGESASFELTVGTWLFADENGEILDAFEGGPIPVETASECPAETDGPRLVIVDQPSSESA